MYLNKYACVSSDVPKQPKTFWSDDRSFVTVLVCLYVSYSKCASVVVIVKVLSLFLVFFRCLGISMLHDSGFSLVCLC